MSISLRCGSDLACDWVLSTQLCRNYLPYMRLMMSRIGKEYGFLKDFIDNGGVMGMDILKRQLRGSLIGLLLVAVLFMMPSMVSAMQFQNPELIGWLGSKGGNSIGQKNALPSSVKGVYYDFHSSAGTVRAYLKESNGTWYSDNKPRFGSTSSSDNTIKFTFDFSMVFYEIKNDKNLPMYLVQTNSTGGGGDVTIIGVNRDGRYFKYIGKDHFKSLYSSSKESALADRQEFIVDGDTLIIQCQTFNKQQWRYLLKWDEKARWFGIAFEKL